MSQTPEREPNAATPSPTPGAEPAADRPVESAGPPRPFTQQWGEALCAAINASESYHAIAARWIWSVALVVQKAADLGWPRDTAVVLSLDHGHCNGVRLVDGSKARAPFIFRGTYANWKRIMRGDVDPIVAMVKGELAVTGSMSTIMMHNRAAKALLEVARTVTTADI